MEGLLMERLLMEGLLMDIDNVGTTSTTDLFGCVFQMYPSFYFYFVFRCVFVVPFSCYFDSFFISRNKAHHRDYGRHETLALVFNRNK